MPYNLLCFQGLFLLTLFWHSQMSSSHVMVFFVLNCLRLEVIVRFIDVSGIVDHHRLISFS